MTETIRGRSSAEQRKSDSVRGLSTAAGAVLVIAIAGFALSWMVAHHSIGHPAPEFNNVFFFLYGQHEQPSFLLLGGFTIATVLYVQRKQSLSGISLDHHWYAPKAWYLALGILALTWFGSQRVLHGLPLSMDEFNAVFQARIFASGQIAAAVPSAWVDLIPAITPKFITFRPDDQAWLSSYLPVYAGIRAVFLKAGADAIVNPVLGALAVPVLFAVARKLWPSDRRSSILAVLLLATSTQYLITSMSWYSMPAHLLFNLCWLLLYLRGGRQDLAALPWVGVLALGLHNPFPHALFVAPFLLTILRTRGTAYCGYVVAVYALGAVAWAYWLRFSLAPVDVAASQAFVLPGALEALVQVMSISMIMSWQTPIVGLALTVCVLRIRHLRPVERDLAVGLLLAGAFYLCFTTSQGHGWGYRYIYGMLGSVVILAVTGVTQLAQEFGTKRMDALVILSVLTTLTIQLPVRLSQVEQFVGPWARADLFLRSQSSPNLAIPSRRIWYGSDLIRNSPWLDPPRMLALPPSDQADSTESAWTGRLGDGLRVIETDELARLGLHVVPAPIDP